MGFFKAPKINIPEPEPAQEELPVVVDSIKEETVNDYNARTKNRKTLLSTILSKQYQTVKEENKQSGNNPGLRQTLG